MAAQDACPDCGERNPPASAFCVFCGAYLGWNEEEGLEDGTGTPPAFAAESTGNRSDPEAPTQVVAPTPPVTARVERVQQTAQPATPVEADGRPVCPRCGHPNSPTLRFCAKCGQPLRPVHLRAPGDAKPTTVPGFWQRLRDPAARLARRNYRRSLPWWRRGRRMLLGMLGVVVAIGLVVALRNHPVAWVQSHLGLSSSAAPTKTTNPPTKSGTSSPTVHRYPGKELSTANPHRFPDSIKLVQRTLMQMHYRPLAETGVYDQNTYKAVYAYQTDHGLIKDGIVGPQTWGSLFGPSSTESNPQ